MTFGDIHDARGELSKDARALYERITRGEQTGQSDSSALLELREWHLVAADPDNPERLVALDPREAGGRRMQAEAEALAMRAARMAGIPDMAEQLSLLYERARGRTGEACEYVSDPSEVNARIGEALAGAEREMLTAQPGGPRSRKPLQIALERDTAALARGVQIRTLYLDTVRDDEVTREWATAMTARGAQFRTLKAPFERCIIIDRQTAFMSDYVVEGSAQHAAWHVRDRAFVAYMARIFDEFWRRGEVWHGDARVAGLGVGVGSGPRTTRMQREILRDTCVGVDQRKTAVRLGISPRKVTRELEALRGMFGAPTTTALAYVWASCPERLIDDDPAVVSAAGVGPGHELVA